jgi:hypothetical protein
MRKTLRAAMLVLVGLLCGGWLWPGSAAEESVVKVKLREYVFHIPDQYSMHGTMPFWLKGLEGLDYSSTALEFMVPPGETRRSIPAYRSKRVRSEIGYMYAVMHVLSDEDLARYHDPE